MNDFLAQSGLKAAVRSALTDLILGLCAASLVLIGAGFLLLAGYAALTRELGPVWAAGLMGAGVLLLAGLVLLILRSRHPAARAQVQPIAAPPQPAVGDPAVMAVFVLGFVLARHLLPAR